jgi:hypothetical protein
MRNKKEKKELSLKLNLCIYPKEKVYIISIIEKNDQITIYDKDLCRHLLVSTLYSKHIDLIMLRISVRVFILL